MTGAGHTLSGLVGSVPLAVIVFNATGSVVGAAAAITCAIMGSTAPDWLEIPYKSTKIKENGIEKKVTKRLLKHRGVTHIVSIWVLIFLWAFLYIKDGENPIFDFELPMLIVSMVYGFAGGGIMHLIGDLPNKQKIPVFSTFDGISLNIWESGKYELLTTFIILSATCCFYYYENKIHANISSFL